MMTHEAGPSPPYFSTFCISEVATGGEVNKPFLQSVLGWRVWNLSDQHLVDAGYADAATKLSEGFRREKCRSSRESPHQ